jgi:signal peptidase II
MSGAVVDFIDLQWWPIFNVADAAIVVGGIGLVLIGLRAPVEEEPSADASTGDQLDETTDAAADAAKDSAGTDSAGADSADG